MKRCKVCGEVKPLDDFYRSAGMRDGHRHDCKQCNLAAKKRRYDADPSDAVRRAREWQQRHADRHNEYQREYRSRPERKRVMRDAYYRRTFGISADDFDAMLEAQDGGARSAASGRSGWRRCTSTTATRPVASVACCA